MSKRYYYTDAIVALYMMKEFGVKFSEAHGANHADRYYQIDEAQLCDFITQAIEDFRGIEQIYVAKESEHIFEPKNYDLAGFTRDDGISTIAQYDAAKKAFINGSFRILKKYNPKIIMRDNKQFFMIEVEND